MTVFLENSQVEAKANRFCPRNLFLIVNYMQHILQKIGVGVTMLATIAMMSPSMAATTTNTNVGIGANLQALSQFTLINGQLTAISGATLPAQLTISIKGPLPKNMGGSKNIHTITVAVEDKTIFSRVGYGKSSLSELALGDNLQIFGRFDDQGILYALSVKDNSIRLTAAAITGAIGNIDSVAQTFTLKHLQGFSAKWLPLNVKVNDNTKIVASDGTALTFADLQTAQQVSVKGVLNTQAHTLIASEIKVKMTPPKPLPFSMKGTLTAISTTSIPSELTVTVTNILPPIQSSARAMAPTVINEVTFTVDANTKITNHSGGVIALKDLALGDSLTVQANMDSAGSITATLVRDDSVDVATTAEGTISSTNSSTYVFVLTKVDSSTVNVAVTGDTTITIPGITTSAFADLKVGYKAEVNGLMNSQTNVLTASSVTVTEILSPPQPLPFSMEGTLAAISTTSIPSMLTVTVTDIMPTMAMGARAMAMAPINEVTFLVDANTKLTNHSGGTIALKDLALGDTLRVQGNMDNFGAVTATTVSDDSIDVTATALSGTVTSTDAVAQRFTLAPTSTNAVYTVQTNASTTFTVPGITPAIFEDLAVGYTVDVMGVLNSNTKIIEASSVNVTATSTSGV